MSGPPVWTMTPPVQPASRLVSNVAELEMINGPFVAGTSQTSGSRQEFRYSRAGTH